MLDQVTNQLGSLTDTAGEISTDLGSVFVDIEAGLKSTLEDLEKRVTGVYEDIITGIEELKKLFQTEIFETLQTDIIDNIINQLESAEYTMQEFWDRSKETSMLSFKDVWFVRNTETMRAQTNEIIPRIKMRIHIITPRLSDIDFVALSKVKKHINVRVSTNFDLNNQEDVDILNQMNQLQNFSVRYYPRENLWAINRDFEEVIVCVVSKDVELNTIQVAGMGSILEEHVKLFAGLLEDVWIQSKKVDEIGFRQEIERPLESYIPKTQSQISFKETKNTVSPIPEESVINKTTVNSFKPSIEIPENIAPTNTFKEPVSSTDFSLSNQFDSLIRNVDTLPGYELAAGLQILQDEILEKKGFSAILRQIRIETAQIKTISGLLDLSEKEIFLKKVKFWREKLDL